MKVYGGKRSDLFEIEIQLWKIKQLVYGNPTKHQFIFKF